MLWGAMRWGGHCNVVLSMPIMWGSLRRMQCNMEGSISVMRDYGGRPVKSPRKPWSHKRFGGGLPVVWENHAVLGCWVLERCLDWFPAPGYAITLDCAGTVISVTAKFCSEKRGKVVWESDLIWSYPLDVIAGLELILWYELTIIGLILSHWSPMNGLILSHWPPAIGLILVPMTTMMGLI